MSVFVNYMREHKIDLTLSKVLMSLLEQDQLPYNPHAGFHRALKLENQAFFLNKISADSVNKALNMPTYLSDISYLAGVRKFTNVWGLASVVKVKNKLSVFAKTQTWRIFSQSMLGLNFTKSLDNCLSMKVREKENNQDLINNPIWL